MNLLTAEDPYVPAATVTAVGTVFGKEVIATQAITVLFQRQFLCLSPRLFLSSEERERARRRLLVTSLFLLAEEQPRRPRPRKHISYIIIILLRPTIVTAVGILSSSKSPWLVAGSSYSMDSLTAEDPYASALLLTALKGSFGKRIII